MGFSLKRRLVVATAFAASVAAGGTTNSFDLKPFKIDLTAKIPRLALPNTNALTL